MTPVRILVVFLLKALVTSLLEVGPWLVNAIVETISIIKLIQRSSTALIGVSVRKT